MKKRLFAGILASAVLGAAFTLPAAASCRDSGTCFHHKRPSQKQVEIKTTAVKTPVKVKMKAIAVETPVQVEKKTIAAKTPVKTKKAGTAVASRPEKAKRVARAAAGSHHSPASDGGRVVALIKAMAPDHGVPTWFALRIAKVESGYNPRARGAAGELGVYQLKCATARGIGFRGNCTALLDPHTNIHYGLKHLSLALKSSRGNLRLAASKHNGGLGRKTEVRGYVALVF